MALESVTHISDLVQTNPTSTDPASQGDDHIRNIKKALKNTFAAITGAVTASHTELNYVKGVTSSIQTQLNNLGTRITNEIADAVSAITGRSIVAGNGLTGGGALDQSRTLTLGTPSSLTASSTNGVTATSHTHAIDNTIARSAITVSAGNGLTGGGDLTANRSIALGTPGNLTATSTNSVSTASHTHAIDNTIARSARKITAGDGLTGGGDLTADRTLSLDLGQLPYNASPSFANPRVVVLDGDTGQSRIGAVSLRDQFGLADSATTITAGNGLTGGGNLSANRSLALGTPGSLSASTTNSVSTNSHTHAIDATIARSARTITAGNGLTGGGDLTANRTIALGTPSSITSATTNSVTATSHTHALGEASVRALIAEGTAGGVGTYALLGRVDHGADSAPNATMAGSNLRYAGLNTGGSSQDRVKTLLGNSPGGTWRLMGTMPQQGYGDGNRAVLGLWMRIS